MTYDCPMTLSNTPDVPDLANHDVIARAAAILRRGGLVAFPTETVYGLGARADDDRAVAAVFAAKGRPRFNPLIAHVASADAAFALGAAGMLARRLAKAFWPGPLTLVLPRTAGCTISLLATAGLDSVALRVPAHPVAQALLREVGLPVAAPSANRSGRLSPTRAADVIAGLGDAVDMVVDGGPCTVGVESTIVDLRDDARPVLLRPGGLARAAIEDELGVALGTPETGGDEDVPRAPGQLASHYAPERPLAMNAPARPPGAALLGFGGTVDADLDLSPGGDTTEAAANLFAMLRTLDRAPFTAIAVAPIPDDGLGEAINDRLRRAAAAR